MSKSKRLRLKDFSAIAKLSHECRDLGADPRKWREHLGQGLHALIHAPLVLVSEVGGIQVGWPVELGSVEWGWDLGLNRQAIDRARELFRKNPYVSPLLTAYLDRLRAATDATATRQELISNDKWKRTFEREDIFLPIGVDEGVISFHELPIAPGEHAGILACRAIHEKPFDEHDKSILLEELRILVPLIGRSLARFQEHSAADLPPRVQRVLACLLEGDSDKQIAAKLFISPYTVNQYTKQIYQHFGVRSRAALLARWIRAEFRAQTISDASEPG